MIIQVNKDVSFGNWECASEAGTSFRSILNVAHSFSERKGRFRYWSDLGHVNRNITYIRHSKKDQENVDAQYCKFFKTIIEGLREGGMLPLLCHCQMGGHRGPTSAIHASVILGYDLEETYKFVVGKKPRLISPRRVGGNNYFLSTMEYLRKDVK